MALIYRFFTVNAGSPSPKVNSVQTSNASKASAPARKLQQSFNINDYKLSPASPGQYPYVVAIKFRKNGDPCGLRRWCTGVLYDYNFVLTAGI